MDIKDSIQFINKFSLEKFLNAIKILLSYHFSKWSGKTIHWGMPISISFEPTTHCNLRCPECPSGLREFTRPTGSLNPSLFQKSIDSIHKKLSYLTFYFQGEPYLNPSFLDMVKYASTKGIYTATSTNAHYLNEKNAKRTIESGLDRLIISIDGTTQETYQEYRIGGELKKVIEGTKEIIKWKKELKSCTPHIIFQYLVVKPNEHQIEDVKKLGKELGVDNVKFKTAQIYNYKEGSELIPSIEKYSRYFKNDDGKYHIKNELSNHCWKLWHSSVITWDGTMIPCCFDKDAKYQMGSLENLTMKKIWNGEKYKKFRSAVLHSRKSIDMCTNCSEGTRVWAN